MQNLHTLVAENNLSLGNGTLKTIEDYNTLEKLGSEEFNEVVRAVTRSGKLSMMIPCLRITPSSQVFRILTALLQQTSLRLFPSPFLEMLV